MVSSVNRLRWTGMLCLFIGIKKRHFPEVYYKHCTAMLLEDRPASVFFYRNHAGTAAALLYGTCSSTVAEYKTGYDRSC